MINTSKQHDVTHYKELIRNVVAEKKKTSISKYECDRMVKNRRILSKTHTELS